MTNPGKPRLLYLSLNDGSDMRIGKELQTLSARFAVELLAVGPDQQNHFVRALPLARVHFIRGNRHSLLPLLQYLGRSAWLLTVRRYASVHLINEPQLLLLWPFLWLQKRVVLDIFDSLFLRRNRPGNQWLALKRLTYAPASRVLVTDENRLRLLPDYLQPRAVVLPNYPRRLANLIPKEENQELTILYYGWLGQHRGTHTVTELLATGYPLRVLMAGWLADSASEALTRHPRVQWLGTLPQAQALEIAAREADYILCVYAPVNQNNINASPNKIYDAIQTRTPVIINREIQVADFVREQRLGYVLPAYEVQDYPTLVNQLQEQKKSFTFSDELAETYTWERVEERLLKAHQS
jgi:hypothetical protein